MSEKYSSWVTLRPQSDRCCRGEAEVHILDFKTTWSESQKVSQTVTEQGKAEQCIFNFKTTWSEFQKPSQTPTEQGEAKLCVLNFKTTLSEFQKPSQTATYFSLPNNSGANLIRFQKISNLHAFIPLLLNFEIFKQEHNSK